MITPLPGVVIAGRYELVRPLASGGMGSVWVAHHRDLDVDVTVKFMAASLVASADARARFEREARVAARLRSQHVVQVLDYGLEDDTPYMVMELLKGESLAQKLSREGCLSRPATALLVVQVCKALRTAHDAALVHRDLKPGNIFLAIKDEDEVAKVLDFGIAKASGLAEGAVTTESGMLLGSAHYMSPEQIRSSRKVDHRSDLWSLGIVLYRVLAGRLPFPGKDHGDVLVRVCSDPIPPPSSVVPDLGAQVDAFFVRALARDPDHRFQSARELAEAFCALAPEAAPAPSSRSPAQSGNQTLPLSAPPVPPSSPPDPMPPGEAARDSNLTTQKLPGLMPQRPALAPEPSLADGAQASAADEPTMAVAPASRAMPESSAPVRVPEEAAAPSRPAPRRIRSLWPVWVVTTLMVFAGLLALAFRSDPPQRAPVVSPIAIAAPTSVAGPPEPAPSPAPELAASSERSSSPSATATAPDKPVRSPGKTMVPSDPYADEDPYDHVSAKPASPAASPSTTARASGRIFGRE